MSWGGPIRPPSPHWVGGGGGVLFQYQTDQKFAAKMRYVYSSVVGLTDI